MGMISLRDKAQPTETRINDILQKVAEQTLNDNERLADTSEDKHTVAAQCEVVEKG